jgi:site-specific DNA recombinase
MAVIRAAGYTRQSKGSERSITEQEEDVRKACAQHNWEIAEIYFDTVSASRFSRKQRPDWARLLADLEDGRFDVLVIWEPSRGDRDLATWAALLATCRAYKVLIHVTSHDHTYDMNQARDWKALAEDGIDSAYESEKTSQRINRTIKSSAALGKPHGRVPYGYRRIYDERTRELKVQEPHPEQAPVVTEIITRIANGVPITTITSDLNARGIPAASGGPWARQVVRGIALSPVYIGKRSFKGQLYEAMWPPLVNEVTFYAAKRVLEDPARKTKAIRPGKARWLLSYIAICDVCEAPLSVRPLGADRDSQHHPLYQCSRKGCVFIRQDWLDAYVTGHVLKLMSEVTFGGDDQKALKLRGEAARLQSLLDDKARACAREEITDRAYSLMEADLLPKIARLTREAEAVAVPLPMRGMSLGNWKDLDIAVKREIVRAAYEIRVRRNVRPGAHGFSPERVIVTLRAEPGVLAG